MNGSEKQQWDVEAASLLAACLSAVTPAAESPRLSGVAYKPARLIALGSPIVGPFPQLPG